MKVTFVAFDGFTDIDLFLLWNLFHRVHDPRYAAYAGPWQVAICADQARITSYSGLTIASHQPLAWAADAGGVFVVSGPGSRAKLEDQSFLGALRLDPRRQIIAAIDSGVLILAKLGLLTGLSATTYPTVFAELEALGVTIMRQPIVVHGNIATGGGCLATQDLAGWMVRRLIGDDPAAAIVDSIARVAASSLNDVTGEPIPRRDAGGVRCL